MIVLSRNLIRPKRKLKKSYEHTFGISYMIKCQLNAKGDNCLSLSLTVEYIFGNRLRYSPREINGQRVWKIERLAP